MGKINEIQQYCQSLKLKDSQHQQYFLDILATNDGAQNIIQLVDKSSGKRATGAEMFSSMVNHARENGYDLLTVREYKGCSDEFEPVATVNFRLSNRKKKKQNNRMPKTYTQPTQVQPQTQQFSGFGSLEAINAINTGLGSLGVSGGLSGLIEESAKRISDGEKIKRYEEEIQSHKSKNASLEIKVENLKEQLEKYKEDYKDLQRNLRDLQHDHKIEIETTNKNNSMLSLGVNALMGIVMEKSGLGNQLSGILGNNSSEVENQSSTENVSLAPINPEKQKYVDAINNYVSDLELSDLEKVAAIAQYISLSTDNLDKAVSFCQSQVTTN